MEFMKPSKETIEALQEHFTARIIQPLMLPFVQAISEKKWLPTCYLAPRLTGLYVMPTVGPGGQPFFIRPGSGNCYTIEDSPAGHKGNITLDQVLEILDKWFAAHSAAF